MMTGLAGSIVPFQTWFDERRNKVRAIILIHIQLVGMRRTVLTTDHHALIEVAHRVLLESLLRLAAAHDTLGDRKGDGQHVVLCLYVSTPTTLFSC